MTAMMSVWNPLADTGSLYLIFWKMKSMLVTIANPKWVKAVKGSKDDTSDSKWIGDLSHLGLVKGSYVPCKAIRMRFLYPCHY